MKGDRLIQPKQTDSYIPLFNICLLVIAYTITLSNVLDTGYKRITRRTANLGKRILVAENPFNLQTFGTFQTHKTLVLENQEYVLGLVFSGETLKMIVVKQLMPCELAEKELELNELEILDKVSIYMFTDNFR